MKAKKQSRVGAIIHKLLSKKFTVADAVSELKSYKGRASKAELESAVTDMFDLIDRAYDTTAAMEKHGRIVALKNTELGYSAKGQLEIAQATAKVLKQIGKGVDDGQ